MLIHGGNAKYRVRRSSVLKPCRGETPAARRLAETLSRHGLKIWIDEGYVHPGDNWMAALEDALQRSSGMIVYIGRLGIQRWVDREVRFGLERSTSDPLFRLVGVLGDGADITAIPPFLRQQQLTDLRDPSRAESEIRRLVQTLATPASEPPIPDSYWSTHSPFRGLQIFQDKDSWLFFGRDSTTEELLAAMARQPVLALIGNSGSGKSSLLRAGLIPALRRGRLQIRGCRADDWKIAFFRPSGDPFGEMAEQLPNQLAPELSPARRADMVRACRSQLPSGGSALRDVIAALVDGSGPRSRILLVADQFEEIFTLTRDRTEQSRYIDLLLSATRMESDVPVHLLIALRADFYSGCLDHPNLAKQVERNLLNLSRIEPESLRELIEKRLALSGASAEPGLLDAILSDTGDEPGNLALLEHALDQLWAEFGGPRRTLTNDSYSKIGRLHGALSRHADRVFEEIAAEGNGPLARQILTELVQLGDGAPDTRRRVSKTSLLELDTPERVESVLGALASSRLITMGGGGSSDPQDAFAEVSHESLIREWRMLREWSLVDREDLLLERRLTEAAREWRSLDCDPNALLKGTRLSQAEEWLVRRPRAAAAVCEFVEQGRSGEEESRRLAREHQEREVAREQELRLEAEARSRAEEKASKQAIESARRLTRFSYVLSIALVLALGAAYIAFRQQCIAQSRAMAADAEELSTRDSSGAVSLAIDAWQTARTDQANVAIARIFPQLVSSLRLDNEIIFSGLSADGQRAVTTTQRGKVQIWNAMTGEVIQELRGNLSSSQYAEFSPDGSRLAIGFDREAIIVDSKTGQKLLTLGGQQSSTISHVRFSPDGTKIVTADYDSTSVVWDASSGEPLVKFKSPADRLIFDAVFSLDGKQVLSYSDSDATLWDTKSGAIVFSIRDTIGAASFSMDGSVVIVDTAKGTQLWDVRTQRALRTVKGGGGRLTPDGRHLVTISGNEAMVWDTSNGHKTASFIRHVDSIRNVRLSADGRFALSSGDDGNAMVWELSTARMLAILPGNSGQFWNADFSHDGRMVLVSSYDKVSVWGMSNGQIVTEFRGHESTITSAEFSKDGERIVTSSADNTARIWGVHGKLVAELKGHQQLVRKVLFSPDDHYVLTASDDGTARLWETASGRLVHTLEHERGSLTDAAFSQDGARIVTTSDIGFAKIWNAGSGMEIAGFRHKSRAFRSSAIFRAAFSPDGKRVATAGADDTVRIWNSSDGEELVTYDATWGAFDVAFSPNGKTLAVSEGEAVTIHDSLTLETRVSLKTEDRLVATTGAVSFSPDGQVLATAGSNTVRAWEVSSGKRLMSVEMSDYVDRIRFSSDGRQLVATCRGSVRIWGVPSGELLWFLLTPTGGNTIFEASFAPRGSAVLSVTTLPTVRLSRALDLAAISSILSH